MRTTGTTKPAAAFADDARRGIARQFFAVHRDRDRTRRPGRLRPRGAAPAPSRRRRTTAARKPGYTPPAAAATSTLDWTHLRPRDTRRPWRPQTGPKYTRAGHRAPRRHGAGTAPGSQRVGQRRAQFQRVVRCERRGVRRDDRGHRAGARDDRRAGDRRLEHRQPEAFDERRMHVCRRRPVTGDQMRVVQRAGETQLAAANGGNARARRHPRVP